MKLTFIILCAFQLLGGEFASGKGDDSESFFYENLIELASSNVLSNVKFENVQLQKTYQERYCLIIFVFWSNHVDDTKPIGEMERLSKLVKRTFKNYSSPEMLNDPLRINDVFADQRYKDDSLIDILHSRYGNIPLKKVDIVGENSYRSAVKRFIKWIIEE